MPKAGENSPSHQVPGLKDAYAEKDLEAAILRGCEKIKTNRGKNTGATKFLWGMMVSRGRLAI